MAEFKIVYFLGNVLGYGMVFLGIIQKGENWKNNILFALAVIFMMIKIGSGILELIKKKYRLTRTLQTQRIESRN
jgi:hypothetical protein